ncbi:uncharacterized protein LY89DRAFT_675400 [Mollisia scopiformis]|uniref:Uncharacterized protein n=1 Tax=Mollisia scopiformis TaxID=149040 RepID=A0A132BBT4_MOLSC|nr:uncharacterized protein LY89DRAFT_675400 [Mollisia scopiformis]KUJ09875.1 hypothetical protein LY89DRAFT_675400 [Mollisia scopiformis]
MSATPDNTSTLPPTREEFPTATAKTLEGEAALYKPVLAAARDLSQRFPPEHISKAFLLIEIEDLAEKELNNIRDDIDKKVKPWDLDRYHRNVLLTPSWTAVPDTPDAFFSRHAGTKARLILRLAGKAIIPKLNDVALHEQIQAYIDRWNTRDIEPEVAERAQKRAQKLENSQKKRQRESTTAQTTASKRQVATTYSGQNSLRQPQAPSAQPSYTRDIPQQGIMTQVQALPTIASLHAELPNFQPHQSLPSLPSTRQATTQTDNVTNYHAFHASPGPYYLNQQNLQTLDEVHQGLRLQLRQQEKEQQQEQQQELFEEIIEPQWDLDGFDYY